MIIRGTFELQGSCIEITYRTLTRTLVLKLDDLEPGTQYRLKMGESIVYAKTLELTSSKTSCEKPSVVPPPVDLHVTELDNELEVSWDPPDCDSIVSYLIRNNGKVIGEGRVVQL